MPATDAASALSEPTDAEVADTALRLMRLLERPAAVPVLHVQLVNELHYWRLAGSSRGSTADSWLAAREDSEAVRSR